MGWAAAGSMRTARWHQTATLLAGGGLSNLATSRGGHTATLLRDGRMLVAGGECARPTTCSEYLASAELYDPRHGSWSATAALRTARAWAQATALADGGVLMTGGIAEGKTSLDMVVLRSAEMYHAPAIR